MLAFSAKVAPRPGSEGSALLTRAGGSQEELSGSWTAFKAIYLSDVSHRNPLLRLTPSHRLTEALELLGSGVHRILIVDEHNRRKVVNILTASDLLRYLDTNSDLIPIKKLMQSVDKMGVGTHAAAGFKVRGMRVGGWRVLTCHTQLVQVLPTVTAKDAFIKMRLCNVRALPIVDAHGKLVGQISASDIRLLFESGKCNMECLELPCLEYARRVHEKTGRDMLIFVEPDTNLSGVLSTMVKVWWCSLPRRPRSPVLKQRVHRVLVTDNLISLAGVISVSDLVELLL